MEGGAAGSGRREPWLSHRLIRIHHDSARIRRRAGQAQRLAVLEDPQPAPDRDRVHEDVELVDQIALDQAAHERRATVHDDVLPPLLLQPSYRLDQVAALHPHILPLDARKRFAEHDFGVSTILRAKEYSG